MRCDSGIYHCTTIPTEPTFIIKNLSVSFGTVIIAKIKKGLCHRLRWLHDSRSSAFEILWRRTGSAESDIERTWITRWVHNITIRHFQQPSTRHKFASIQWLSVRGRSDICWYSNANVLEKQANVRVLGAWYWTWHTRKSQTFDFTKHDVLVSLSRYRIDITNYGSTANAIEKSRKSSFKSFAIQSLVFITKVRLCACSWAVWWEYATTANEGRLLRHGTNFRWSTTWATDV